MTETFPWNHFVTSVILVFLRVNCTASLHPTLLSSAISCSSCDSQAKLLFHCRFCKGHRFCKGVGVDAKHFVKANFSLYEASSNTSSRQIMFPFCFYKMNCLTLAAWNTLSSQIKAATHGPNINVTMVGQQPKNAIEYTHTRVCTLGFLLPYKQAICTVFLYFSECFVGYSSSLVQQLTRIYLVSCLFDVQDDLLDVKSGYSYVFYLWFNLQNIGVWDPHSFVLFFLTSVSVLRIYGHCNVSWTFY